MVYIPLRVLARLEKGVRTYNAMYQVMPEQAERLRKAIILTVASYAAKPARQRAATYLSRDVRFKGWWRNWLEAGLQHLEDGAMIRWCGFPKNVVFELAEEVAKDPAVASLLPGSRFWKRADPALRPTCDVLDLVVLTLREIATIGYQHQLCTDMGIHMGNITKYLHRGKKALRAALGRLHAARVGFFEDQELGFAAHHALEAQHGECPRKGIFIAFALDGTVTAVHTPLDEELKLLYWSVSKHISGVNTIFLIKYVSSKTLPTAHTTYTLLESPSTVTYLLALLLVLVLIHVAVVRARAFVGLINLPLLAAPALSLRRLALCLLGGGQLLEVLSSDLKQRLLPPLLLLLLRCRILCIFLHLLRKLSTSSAVVALRLSLRQCERLSHFLFRRLLLSHCREGGLGLGGGGLAGRCARGHKGRSAAPRPPAAPCTSAASPLLERQESTGSYTCTVVTWMCALVRKSEGERSARGEVGRGALVPAGKRGRGPDNAPRAAIPALAFFAGGLPIRPHARAQKRAPRGAHRQRQGASK